MVSQEYVAHKRQRRHKHRDDEPVTGFDSYHRLACKLAYKHYLPWFPTRDDLIQAAALAAVEARAVLGEQTTLKVLCRSLDRVIYQQAAAYGLSSTTNRKAGTRHNIRREYYLCEILTEDNLSSQLEFQRGAIGVGEFTIQAARQLHRIVNIPDPLDLPDQRKAELRARMHQVLASDPELRALRDWYLSRNNYFGYEAMEREGLYTRNKGHRLIVRARLLAGVEHNPYDLEMAQKVVTAYQATPDKRTRQLGARLGLSKTSVQKWLTLARAIGLLAPAKSLQEQIAEAYQLNPTASSREIAQQVGVSKTTVLRSRKAAKVERLVA